VAGDTGFSDVLPTGTGLLAFTSPDEAVAAIEAATARYEGHCRAARELAMEHFAAGKVLNTLLETAMSSGSRRAERED